ncbi:MAG: hypothetical protein ABIH49_02035 [archaeon]
MVSKPDKAILEYKKSFFLKEVEKAANSLGAKNPKVRFWNHYENHFDKGERAHIHHEEKIICIAEPELKTMSEDDIRKTATHEVSHLQHIGHGGEFHETHSNLELGSWEPPSGTTGAIPESLFKKGQKSKREKDKIIKNECNRHKCDKKKNLSKCKFCELIFCLEHKNPTLAGMPKFNSTKLEDIEFLEKSYKTEGGHPCIPYWDYRKEKKKKEDRENDKAWENYDKARKSHLNFQSNTKEESFNVKDEEDEKILFSSYYPQKKEKLEKKLNKSNWKFVFFIVFIIILGSLLYFGYSVKNSGSQFESKSLTGVIFNNINNLREQNNLPILIYNSDAYKMAVHLAINFYNTNNYYISRDNLNEVSQKYSLTNVEVLSTKLENLEESSFNLMYQQWTGREVFNEKVLNPKFTNGAIGCYHESCVFVLY